MASGELLPTSGGCVAVQHYAWMFCEVSVAKHKAVQCPKTLHCQTSNQKIKRVDLIDDFLWPLPQLKKSGWKSRPKTQGDNAWQYMTIPHCSSSSSSPRSCHRISFLVHRARYFISIISISNLICNQFFQSSSIHPITLNGLRLSLLKSLTSHGRLQWWSAWRHLGPLVHREALSCCTCRRFWRQKSRISG